MFDDANMFLHIVLGHDAAAKLQLQLISCFIWSKAIFSIESRIFPIEPTIFSIESTIFSKISRLMLESFNHANLKISFTRFSGCTEKVVVNIMVNMTFISAERAYDLSDSDQI